MHVNDFEHYAQKKILELLSVASMQRSQSMAKELQQTLGELTVAGVNAVAPPGHCCADCNRPGQLYCYVVAIERARGLRQ